MHFSVGVSSVSPSEHHPVGLIKDGLDLEGHPVLCFIIREDFLRLFHFAKNLGYQESGEGYVSKCDLCLDLRQYLCSVQGFEELNPKEFYEHLG